VALSATWNQQTARLQVSDAEELIVDVQASRAVDFDAVFRSGAEGLHSSSWPLGARDASGVQRFAVHWGSGTVTDWGVRATIYGICPAVGECRAPENESVKIVLVTVPPPRDPAKAMPR
jgi:hypothetical protein